MTAFAQPDPRNQWDKAAAGFDDEPDHGLRDPEIRQAWADLLQRLLGDRHHSVLDVGCGTGSLSVLLAQLGHEVTGIDSAPSMLTLARTKATQHRTKISFQLADAAAPALPSGSFSAVVCRHVLWTLPDPAAALRHWSLLLRPGGRMLLIEGFWHTGAGLRSAQIVEAMPSTMIDVATEQLSGNAVLWGAAVRDERYAVVATREPVP